MNYPENRYTRPYELKYLNEVKLLAAVDPRIEIHDVTTNVDQYYMQSDVLLCTSTNEVTPMVGQMQNTFRGCFSFQPPYLPHMI